MSKVGAPPEVQAAMSRLESVVTSQDGLPELTPEERRQLDEATRAYFTEMERLGDELLSLEGKKHDEAIFERMDVAARRLEERHLEILGPERADRWAKSLLPALREVERELERVVPAPPRKVPPDGRQKK